MRLHYVYYVLAAVLLALIGLYRDGAADTPGAGPVGALAATAATPVNRISAAGPTSTADSAGAPVGSSQDLAVAPEYAGLFPNEMASPAAAFVPVFADAPTPREQTEHMPSRQAR